MSHFSVLNHMVRLGDGKTPLELAHAFQVTKGTMTNTLGALSRRGLISIAPNEKDGRSKLVFLTDAGRAFQAEAIASLEPVFERLSGQLDLEAMAKALPLLEEVRKVLDENRET